MTRRAKDDFSQAVKLRQMQERVRQLERDAARIASEAVRLQSAIDDNDDTLGEKISLRAAYLKYKWTQRSNPRTVESYCNLFHHWEARHHVAALGAIQRRVSVATQPRRGAAVFSGDVEPAAVASDGRIESLRPIGAAESARL